MKIERDDVSINIKLSSHVNGTTLFKCVKEKVSFRNSPSFLIFHFLKTLGKSFLALAARETFKTARDLKRRVLARPSN